MLPATKKYIQIPSHDYLKIKKLLTSIAEEYKYRAKVIDQYCPPDVKQIKGPTRSEERYFEINKILSELELHSRVIEDY